MKKSLYVTGDSFCFHREDKKTHWPAKLARMLGTKLQGRGHLGQGWWPSRVDLLEYAQTKAFQDTDIFVFCHTDIYRPLTGNPGWATGYSQEITDFYIKYLADYNFNTWCSVNWYKELSQLLKDKTVVHVHCFDSNRDIRTHLEGLHISTELLRLSRFNRQNDVYRMTHSLNHFDELGNSVLAEMIYNSILQKSDQVDLQAFEQLVYK